MPSFRISITPSRRAAARFVTQVRRAFQKAYAEEQKKSGLSQAAIARAIGVHRSVINRELMGRKDITVGRIGELAWAMGRVATFGLAETFLDTAVVPIKAVTADISQPVAKPTTDANEAIVEEIKRQVQEGVQIPIAAAA